MEVEQHHEVQNRVEEGEPLKMEMVRKVEGEAEVV